MSDETTGPFTAKLVLLEHASVSLKGMLPLLTNIPCVELYVAQPSDIPERPRGGFPLFESIEQGGLHIGHEPQETAPVVAGQFVPEPELTEPYSISPAELDESVNV